MEAIRKFIDFAGPAVYVVMIVLCDLPGRKAGDLGNISLNLATKHLSFGRVRSADDDRRHRAGGLLLLRPDAELRRLLPLRPSRSRPSSAGNFLGLPVNFLFFSMLTVVTASATVPVFGELITDPIQTVERIDSAFAILLGGLTFVIATVGINIVANFISPAFDFSNVNPKRISWRMGGMIAAVGSVLLTPWNWYNNDDAHPLHAGHPRRLDRPAVRRPDRRLLPRQQAEGLGRRHVHHGHQRPATGSATATTPTRWPPP